MFNKCTGFFQLKAAICCICFFLLFSSVWGQSKKVHVIELRNYLLKPGQRQHFVDSFEITIKDTLNHRGNYVLGEYSVKNSPDNFVWLRGFDDMTARLQALQGFYKSEFWKQHVSIPQKYVLGYTNVYLLKPLHILKNNLDSVAPFEADWFTQSKGIAVVDFFVKGSSRT